MADVVSRADARSSQAEADENRRARRRAYRASLAPICAINCLECGSEVLIRRKDKVGCTKFCSRSCGARWVGRASHERVAAMRATLVDERVQERTCEANRAKNARPEIRARNAELMRALASDAVVQQTRIERVRAALTVPETRMRMRANLKRIQETPELELKRTSALPRGAEHHAYRDGSGSKQRPKALVKQWRTAVFQRDDYTCQGCGQRGGRLQADHIRPYSEFPDLRWDLNNGRTLCEPCHRQTPTYGRKQALRLKALDQQSAQSAT